MEIPAPGSASEFTCSAMKLAVQTMHCLLLLIICSMVQAHHSNAEYDRTTVTEIEGEIVRVVWRNPHVGLWVRSRDDAGNEIIWRMEAADLLGTLRRGVTVGTFSNGQHVKVAGFASGRRDAYMLITNVLLPDGQEILLTGNAESRWSENITGGGNWAAAAEVSADTEGAGIFRVWTLDHSNRPAFADNPPLTESARAVFEVYDSYNDPALQCAELGMPRVITQTGPHPIAFIDLGETILLRGEYFDVQREIHMNQSDSPGSVLPSPLGYSVGLWEDGALLVNTSRVNYPWFDINGLAGIPQSEAVSFEERFYLNDDGTELHMDITISDPNTFTETLSVEDYAVWFWRPEIDILPYRCEVD